MRIVITWATHGQFKEVYNKIAQIEKEGNQKVELLLICGDVYTIRNNYDMKWIVHERGILPKYCEGKEKASILTILIGGKNEASNYLQELPYGGWVAPNIYYLGYAGVVNYKGIRIGGVSGLYVEADYHKGHFELPPYDKNTIRSVSRCREQEMFRLKQLSGAIDIMLSHNWPRNIADYANEEELDKFWTSYGYCKANRKIANFFSFGSPPCRELLQKLKPKYWFSGSKIRKFVSIVPHEDKTKTTFMSASHYKMPLTIDVDVDETDSSRLQYDLEWLTILYLTKHLTNISSTPSLMPSPGDSSVRWNFEPTTQEKESVLIKFDKNLEIPENFESTTDTYGPKRPRIRKPVLNPQTTLLCDRLGIEDPLRMVFAQKPRRKTKIARNIADTSKS